MYVKLFGSILDSSIWAADLATRVVWITMLAMADEYGIVYASVTGLARRAAVSDSACRKALKALASPDGESRTETHEGRRIEALEGGWRLLNYQKYRELRTRKQMADAIRQSRHRHKQRDESHASVTSNDVTTEAVAVASDTETPSRVPRATQGKPTWLSPYLAAWHTAYGGKLSPGKAARFLAPIHQANPVDCLAHWGRYLAATDGRYASPARFAETYGEWSGAARENGGPVEGDAAYALYRAAGVTPPVVRGTLRYASRAACLEAIDRAKRGLV